MSAAMKFYGSINARPITSRATFDDSDGNGANEASGKQSRDETLISRSSFAVRAIVGFASLMLLFASSGKGRGTNIMSLHKRDMLSLAIGPYDDDHDMNEPLFYDDQLVNHFSTDPDASSATWSNRYYKSTKYFKGPGSPIFVIIGGEGALDHGMLYPFVTEHLAPRFGAAVIEIEHRFYGPYRPIMGREATVQELLELLTPQQAMADMVRLTKHFKDELNCLDYGRTPDKYCPVITVGGSYPGFLSAMFRLVYPDFVDISYASSAPLKLYDQSANQYVYYDIVTQAAERLSAGCARAVRETLERASVAIMESSSMEDALKSFNMCVDKVPDFIKDLASLNENVMMSVSFSFANFDMDAYPPSKDLAMYKACQVFQNKDVNPVERLKNFLKFDRSEYQSEADDGSCFDLSAALSGSGNDDQMWDFQLCTTQINPIGCSTDSMFIPREWTLDSLVEYCQATFGVTPHPHALADALGFDDLLASGASRILFTNGLQDMWSGGSYLENVSDSILALNFENGAHHSDLSHVGPSDGDTYDIKQGFVQITNILAKWLDEIKADS
eukprot:CCRYP_009090-RA/>CCRYP_009090-RA protein AED:0.07 eAED:0.07 QI:0/-1/0/1/-1/1/1/0/558